MRSTIALLALILLTGCGSSTTGGSPPAAGAATTPADGTAGADTGGTGGIGIGGGPQCPEDQVIMSTLGVTVAHRQGPIRDAPMTILCDYDGPMADGKTANITLRMQIHTSASDYADFRSRSESYGITDRTGIGDQAFTYVFGPKSGQLIALVARKGALLIYLASQASLEQEAALVNQL
jgi:hypothetical protein